MIDSSLWRERRSDREIRYDIVGVWEKNKLISIQRKFNFTVANTSNVVVKSE